MQTEALSESVRTDASLSKTIREPIDPQRDCDSTSAHSISQRSSPHAEDLNQVGESSLASVAALRSPYVALPSRYGNTAHRTPHISGEPNTNMHASSNPTMPTKSRQSYSPQMRTSASGPLSPVPTGKVKAVNAMYTPLRLDSQQLASPWPASHLQQRIASPTRAGSGPGGAAYSSYWNLVSSPVPYPCGSPRAYSSGLRSMSPSTQSLRHQQHQQQQTGNDDSSPIQLSISTLGRESSFISTLPTYASPSAIGMVHTTLLDAPLQVSLVPPVCGEDYPYFSFGNSILQSTPYTPTVQSPTTRGHSIYHDAMRELSQHKPEMDNPLSTFQGERTRPGGHDGVVPSVAVSSASLTPLMVDVAVQLHHLPPRAISEVSFASASGAVVPLKIKDGTLMDWTTLAQMSPPSPRLPEPLTARPTADAGDTVCRGPSEADVRDEEEEEDGEDGSHCSSRNSSPEKDEAAAADAVGIAESGSISLNPVASEEIPAPLGGLGRTRRPHENDEDASTSGLEREGSSIAAVSLSEANFAFHQLHSRATATPSPEQGRLGSSGLDISVPVAAAAATQHPRRHSTKPTTPGIAPPPSTGVQLGVPDLHLFMPSPVDESAHGFAAQRDGVARRSPSEHSVSALSLVPHLGLWHTSSALLSSLQSVNMSPSSAPSVRASLGDLVEVLRLLQSDVANVYSRVSSNEHTVRHWISSTLGALLRLTVEMLHSVHRSAADEKEASEVVPEAVLSFAQLYAEMQCKAVGCGDALRATIPAVQRDRDILEPLLLTSMLARGAIHSLLRSLETAYLSEAEAATTAATPAASAKLDGSRDATATTNTTTTAAAATATSIPAHRRVSSVLPVPGPLTSDRVEELMDSELLSKELGGEWCQFSSSYNRKLLRYLFLRVLHSRLSGSESAVHDGLKDASSQHSSPASSGRGGAPTNALRTIEAAWADDQLKRWSASLQRSQQRAETRGSAATLNEVMQSTVDDEATLQLFRESLCQDFPSCDAVLAAFPAFRDGESWRCWYVLLGQVMEYTLRAQDTKELYEYVVHQFSAAPSAPATAALHAVSVGQITKEQVEEALESVGAELAALQEEGRARRVAILQLLLRRIFVLSVVASVHRAAGRDAVVSNAQLATYVQVQRKSLEEVEAQLTAEYAEAGMQLASIHGFLEHMSAAPQERYNASESPMNGALHTQLYPATTTPHTPSTDPQWNMSMVGPLAALLARAHSRSGTMERHEEADDRGRSDDEEAQRRVQDALHLVADASTHVVDTIGSLCALLQSDVDPREMQRGYDVAPTKLPAPSTRALRRLQASLSETHRAVMVALTSLHID